MKNRKKPSSFEDNYKTLQDIALKLRNEEFIEVDKLLPMIKTATSAYEKCKTRLQSVKLALNEHFKEQDGNNK